MSVAWHRIPCQTMSFCVTQSSTIVGGARTLDYFVAHELTHQLTGQAIGALRYYRLPQWVREGYADYVGKSDSFDYGEAERALLADSPDMNWQRSGLYARFQLFVAYLLDHQRWTVGAAPAGVLYLRSNTWTKPRLLASIWQGRAAATW